MNSIGKNIRTLRHQNRWSQKELAQKLNISIPAVSKIETGSTDMNISRLDQIARVFNVTSFDIMSKADENQRFDHSLIIDDLREKVMERESLIIDLQIKLISLYEEIRKE